MIRKWEISLMETLISSFTLTKYVMFEKVNLRSFSPTVECHLSNSHKSALLHISDASYNIEQVPPSDTKEYIIYFWQGRYSSMDEEGASAILAVQLDEELGGSAVQVRVTQGKEPIHFRSIFDGQMIIHSGGVASGFKNVIDHDEIDDDGCRLYQVKGNSAENTYAFAVEEKASSLNSSSCFLCLFENVTILWKGRHSEEHEYDAASKLAAKLGSGEIKTFEEGSESDRFWEKLGGKEEYAELRADDIMPNEPRLFRCTDVYGDFSMEEIAPFTQEDLNVDDVMLLDIGISLYVWIGSGSNNDERTKAYDSAKKYLEVSEDEKHEGAAIVTVISGSEPIIFTQWFDDWDPELAKLKIFVDPYELKLQEQEREKQEQEEEESEIVQTEEPMETNEATATVDPAQREALLSDEEFVNTFNMNREEFASLPKWKQIMKKKEVGLF